MKRGILSAKLRLVAGILTGIFGVGTPLLTQEVSGLEIIRTLEHPNYSISALDCYFENGQQLIAYSNSSGGSGGDTLVIYDFAADAVINELPGIGWKYDIRFIDENQLLFLNNNSFYRLVNFSAPTMTLLQDDVITFRISENKELVATLRYEANNYWIEIDSFDSVTGTLTNLEMYTITDIPDLQDSKLCFSADGSYLALNGGYEMNYVYLINRNTQNLIQIPTPDNEGTFSPVFYTQDGNRWLAVGGGYANGGIEVIDVDALEVSASIQVFPHYNYALAFDQNDEYLVCGGYDGIIKLFRAEGMTFTEIQMYPVDAISHLLFTQDNQYVISAHGNGSVASVNIHQILSEPSAVSQIHPTLLRLHPNPVKTLLHLQDIDGGRLSIYDLKGSEVIRMRLTGSTADVRSLAPGIYHLQLLDPHGLKPGWFVKE